MEILEYKFYHNTVADYLIAIAIMVVGTLLVKVFKKRFFNHIQEWSKHTATHVDDFIVVTIERVGIPLVNLIIIYIGIRSLDFPAKVESTLRNVWVVILTFFAVRLITSVIQALLRTFMHRQGYGEERIRQFGSLLIIINVLIWILAILFLFDNMGYNVTSLVTGLGIGGIAVALAAQNILGDLFNYFVIFLDRPFEVNDFITVDDKMGTVEYIGIKTTRVASLTGEQLVFANSDLTKSRIHNFKRMATRRIEFSIAVAYDISPETLAQIPSLLKEIVEAHERVKFDRAHFISFEESSLKFVVVYIVQDSDYNVYMDIQQSINLKIFERFAAMGVRFAHPTSIVQLTNREKENEGVAEPPKIALESK